MASAEQLTQQVVQLLRNVGDLQSQVDTLQKLLGEKAQEIRELQQGAQADQGGGGHKKEYPEGRDWPKANVS